MRKCSLGENHNGMILAIANAMGLREDMIATGGKVDELLKSTLFCVLSQGLLVTFSLWIIYY